MALLVEKNLQEITRLPMPTTILGPWPMLGVRCTHLVHAKGDVQGTFQRKVVTEVKKEVPTHIWTSQI
jgi:hypothetical protein